MIIKQIKLTNVSKDRLGRLKGKTGIKNWNVLCRWALCYSLSENTMPTDIQIVADSNIYDAIMIAWCKNMGLPTDEETLAKYFKLHIERGIAHLSGTNFIKNLDDLLDLAIEEK